MNLMKGFIFKTIVLLTLVFAIACSDEENIQEIDNPKVVTTAFFNALYNERDVDKAASVCSPQIAKLLKHYRSVPSIGRYMFNMMYDKVEIKADNSGVKIREQFKQSATVTIYFNGTYQNQRIKDVKRVLLKEQGNRWIISEILKDPF
jgi:hypothetical protein